VKESKNAEEQTRQKEGEADREMDEQMEVR